MTAGPSPGPRPGESRLELRAREGGPLRCPFCHDALEPGLTQVCPGCEAPHHPTCLREAGRCATCGREPWAAPARVAPPAARPDPPPAADPAFQAVATLARVAVGFLILAYGAGTLVAWGLGPTGVALVLAAAAALVGPVVLWLYRCEHPRAPRAERPEATPDPPPPRPPEGGVGEPAEQARAWMLERWRP